MAKKIQLKCEATELITLLKELDSQFVNLPDHVGKFFLDVINSGAKLAAIDRSVTTRTDVTVLLKPTDFLLDAMAAIRAGDFDYFIE